MNLFRTLIIIMVLAMAFATGCGDRRAAGLQQAWVLIENKDYDEAAEILSSILESDPTAPIVANNLAVLLVSQSKFDEADQILSAAIDHLRDAEIDKLRTLIAFTNRNGNLAVFPLVREPFSEHGTIRTSHFLIETRKALDK